MFAKYVMVACLLSPSLLFAQTPGTLPTLESISEFDPLFRNCKFQYSYTQENILSAPAASIPPKAVKSNTIRYEATLTKGKYHYTMDAQSVCADGTSSSLRSIYASDGRVTQSNIQGQVGNVIDERVPIYPMQLPHLLGTMFFGEISLPDMKSPSKLVRRYELLPFRDVDSVEFTEHELSQVAGVECKRIRAVFLGPAQERKVAFDFFVAPSKNFLVAKTVKYGADPHSPLLSTHEVEEWTEVGQGLWIPKRVTGTSYRQIDNGPETFVVSNETVEVQKVVLNPQVDDSSIFHTVPMPAEGKPVFHINGGNITKTTNIPAQQYPTGRAWVWASWIAGNVGIVLLLVGLTLWWRARQAAK